MAYSITPNQFPAQPTVVIDWEGSGPIIGNMCGAGPATGHRALGFGVAVGYIDPSTRDPVICARMSVGILPPDLISPPGDTAGFKALWEARGWDADTFGFWSGRAPASQHHLLTGHLPALVALLSPARDGSPFAGSHMVVRSYAEAAHCMNSFLAEVERKSPTGAYVLVTDVLAYDPALTFGLLAQNGYFPPTHLRNGTYRRQGSYDEESLLITKPSTQLDWDTDIKPRRDSLNARATSMLPQFLRVDHHPQADATRILMRVLLASLGTERKRLDTPI